MSTGKIINCGSDSQNKIIEGIKKAAAAVKVTMGPAGKVVAISDGALGESLSRDGVTVIKSVSFKDPEMNMGASLVRKAADRSNSEAGDGTSTTTLLTEELILKGQKAVQTGANVNEIKSGMLKAGKWMNEYIKNHAIKVDGDMEKIRKVATISANNDPEVGNLVVDCMNQVGTNGVITADIASGLDTIIDVTTGMKLTRGWSSPMFVTSPEDGKCVMDDPYVIVIGERISSMGQIIPLLENVVKSGRPFLIICDEMDEVVTATLTYNVMSGAVRCCVVKGIDFGDARENLMADVAVACGGKYISSKAGNALADVTPECFGAAKKVVVSRDNTIIFEGAGEPSEVQARVDILKKRLEDPSISAYDKSKFETRIANLSGGIAVIKSGGAVEAEKLNRKATIEDAILAAKSAIAEGCAPGSGYIYLKGAAEMEKDTKFLKSLTGDELEGAKIVISSLPVIMRTVVENAGASGDLVLSEIQKSKKENYGFNAKTKKFGNLLDEGIMDSAKVLRVALENSISTASMVLLIDCTIVEEPEDKPQA